MRIGTRVPVLSAVVVMVAVTGLGGGWAQTPAATGEKLAVVGGVGAEVESPLRATAGDVIVQPRPAAGSCFVSSYQPSAEACKEWCYLEQGCGVESYDPRSQLCTCGTKF